MMTMTMMWMMMMKSEDVEFNVWCFYSWSFITNLYLMTLYLLLTIQKILLHFLHTSVAC